ncbi:hypothetical protein C8R47DRAFT_1102662 [Mycena vitilis]|nr:hypothetical protein C8R47DRAFT_1102662 [Mycena vitilis]
MSSNSASASASALKRRREDTAGGSIPTSTFYTDGSSGGPASATGDASGAPKAVPTDQYGGVWQSIHHDLVAHKHPVPSPTMVGAFADIHLRNLDGYKGGQTSFQRATLTCNGYAQSASAGAPSVVTNHLKLPAYQLVKSAPGVDEDPRVAEAQKVANEALTKVHKAATELLATVYAVQVEHCRKLVNAGACADRFAAELTAYCKDVIINSGFEDVNRYETAVAMLKAAFVRQLEELAIDFTAKTMKTAASKEAKAVTLANARADVEMMDATKPVTDTIGEEIKKQLALQLPALLANMKTASAPAPSANNASLSSSSTNGKKPQKKQTPYVKPKGKAFQPKASGSNTNANAKSGGNNGNANAGGSQQSQSAKGKGKGKAKQTEEEDNNSD